LKLHLKHKEKLEGDVVSFVFDAPADFKWQPGQYAKYSLPHPNPDDRGTERWFTIAAPTHEGHPRITTRISDQRSSFKSALMNLKPGDSIEAEAPEGDFIMGDEHSQYVFIAGGIGFTPFHAILSELDYQKTMPRVTILYGTRDEKPLFHQELDELAAKYPQLELHYIVEPERIDEDIVRRHVSDLKTPYFYISGPEPMVEAFDKMLLQMGVPEGNLHRDYFPGYTW
jgi:ferredoxin-NADP reductase